ncbi:hypothetical protein OAM08_00330 [Pelagibacteraceae bacterium]|nr:hypothetical protein [Pelagibacteraceae bacterium]
MHENLDKIKSLEGSPRIIKNFINPHEIEQFLKLYSDLPITVNNLKQKVIKKRWISGFGEKQEKILRDRIKSEIGDFNMDNINEKDGTECLGLFQESFNPIGLHVDGGFNLNDVIYKQTLLPLSNFGETIIFKNRYYGPSTNFTNNKSDLKENSPENLKKGKNVRSSDHLAMYGGNSFNINDYNKYLKHEDINNLKGLEVEFVYKWKLGELFIFDRTHLHCSSCNIDGKKIGLATFTKK